MGIGLVQACIQASEKWTPCPFYNQANSRNKWSDSNINKRCMQWCWRRQRRSPIHSLFLRHFFWRGNGKLTVYDMQYAFIRHHAKFKPNKVKRFHLSCNNIYRTIQFNGMCEWARNCGRADETAKTNKTDDANVQTCGIRFEFIPSVM